MKNMSISFGDNVRVRDTVETQAAGVAGLIGQVYGETTPSVTGIDIIGHQNSDYAINVFFEERDESLWFAENMLEFVDHSAGTEITLKGVDKKWTRSPEGDWVESPGEKRYKSFWERITSGRMFRKSK
ncbi:hypothetical protein [Candidatus Leptofilum sp.]|uniref:hypothetical protein n=1 Tax=Candidatus Leptofilum sp. TaxID=3241576 RepID=UPI003B58C2D5